MKSRQIIIILMGIALILIIALAWYSLVKHPADLEKSVDSYTTCIKVFPVDVRTMEYPAHCTTPGGRTFVEPTPTPTATQAVGIANPASVYCEQQGGKLKITTDATTGGQTGMCTLKSGKVCEEWAYFRGECK